LACNSDHTFYWFARSFPPGSDEYRTKREKSGEPPSSASDEVKRSYEAPSAFDSEENTRLKHQDLSSKGQQALGTRIDRSHVPEGAGLTWEGSFGAGHYSLFGNLEDLAKFLDLQYVAGQRSPGDREE
jgi:hypothetical protein